MRPASLRAQALETLQARFRGSRIGEPTVDEAKWFLRDRDFEVNEAFEKLSATLQWRRESNIQEVTYSKIANEDSAGKAYLHTSTDIYNRPVLVIRVEKCALLPTRSCAV